MSKETLDIFHLFASDSDESDDASSCDETNEGSSSNEVNERPTNKLTQRVAAPIQRVTPLTHMFDWLAFCS